MNIKSYFKKSHLHFPKRNILNKRRLPRKPHGLLTKSHVDQSVEYVFESLMTLVVIYIFKNMSEKVKTILHSINVYGIIQQYPYSRANTMGFGHDFSNMRSSYKSIQLYLNNI